MVLLMEVLLLLFCRAHSLDTSALDTDTDPALHLSPVAARPRLNINKGGYEYYVIARWLLLIVVQHPTILATDWSHSIVLLTEIRSDANSPKSGQKKKIERCKSHTPQRICMSFTAPHLLSDTCHSMVVLVVCRCCLGHIIIVISLCCLHHKYNYFLQGFLTRWTKTTWTSWATSCTPSPPSIMQRPTRPRARCGHTHSHAHTCTHTCVYIHAYKRRCDGYILANSIGLLLVIAIVVCSIHLTRLILWAIWCVLWESAAY